MLPLFVDLRLRKVIVFGGGQVGLRKALYFAKEAEVVVVSKDFCGGFERSDIELVREDALSVYADWIGWSDIVIAAMDDRSANEIVINEAAARGKLFNSADGRSNFLIPSVVEREGYTVAMSTLGRSPAMSKYLRIILDRTLAPEYGLMISLQEELRAEARIKIAEQRSRERFLWEVLEDDDIWGAVRIGDIEKAKVMAKERMVNFIGRDPQRTHNA
ncbi:MAG: bifunctional precorrin-2 dehydrogenase/sirohydrochlorin ferrochelatase [Methanomassiliicoccales archaeon]|jgi:siroheme synthase-like protein